MAVRDHQLPPHSCAFLFFALCFFLLGSCSYPGVRPPAPQPSPSYSPTPLPSSPHPVSPTPSPTPLPLLTPAAVAATVSAGQARVGAYTAEPLCLRWQDTDDDGEPEWVGLHLRPTDPPQLAGFVLDGPTWYDLVPPQSETESGVGEYPACELEVRDLNADGRTEVAFWGHAGAAIDRLHIFAWDGSRYALLGTFEGEGGVRIEETDGDLVEEIVVRLRPEGDLVREIVYTWDGAHYAWTWDRYAWFFPDRPHAYVDDSPLHALVSFYLALNDRDLPGAYALLSPTAQATRPYDAWALGFATTLAVEVGAARVMSQDGNTAAVAAQVRALDNSRGRVIATLYDVEWRTTRLDAGWRLDHGETEMLDQWELPYYP